MVEPPGVEPGSSVCQTDILPLDYGPSSAPGWSRTTFSGFSVQRLDRFSFRGRLELAVCTTTGSECSVHTWWIRGPADENRTRLLLRDRQAPPTRRLRRDWGERRESNPPCEVHSLAPSQMATPTMFKTARVRKPLFV